MSVPESNVQQSDAVLQTLKVERVSTGERIARGLRERILSGELAPGTPLQEARMVPLLGVSRNTVREALKRLASEGLVQLSPYRGATVTRLSESDVIDIFRTRLALELQAIGAKPPSGEQAAQLEQAAREFEQAAKNQDWVNAMESDLRFHCALVSRIGSDRLTQFYSTVLAELRLAFLILDRTDYSDRVKDVAIEHHKLAALLAQGEATEARKVLREHLEEAQRGLLRVLEAGAEMTTSSAA